MDIWNLVDEASQDEDEVDIWDLVEEAATCLEEDTDSQNKYLKNHSEGVALLSRLLGYNKNISTILKPILKFDNLIRTDFLRFTSIVDLPNEATMYKKLLSLKERLFQIENIKLLQNKNIVAIGGGFSAGKSKFINSIVGEDILPENQTPTTSIPSFIAYGEDKIFAYSFSNSEIALDREAVEALSHAFYEKYNLSFTRVIKNILIQSSKQKYKSIVFLDTPGYTKAESHKKEDNTDEHTAREHLKIADCLIWLIDIENGTITDKDLNFILKLKFSKPILFVFNKADKKHPKLVKETLDKTVEVIKKSGIKAVGVTAYSSLEKKEYFNNYIEDYLSAANRAVGSKRDVVLELDSILKQCEDYLEKTKNSSIEARNNISKSIRNANTLEYLVSLATIYSELNSKIIINNRRISEFEEIKYNLKRQLDEILNTH